MIKDIEMLEARLTAVVDLLVESGVINLTEFEDKVKEKLQSNWNWLDSNRAKSNLVEMSMYISETMQ